MPTLESQDRKSNDIEADARRILGMADDPGDTSEMTRAMTYLHEESGKLLELIDGLNGRLASVLRRDAAAVDMPNSESETTVKEEFSTLRSQSIDEATQRIRLVNARIISILNRLEV